MPVTPTPYFLPSEGLNAPGQEVGSGDLLCTHHAAHTGDLQSGFPRLVAPSPFWGSCKEAGSVGAGDRTRWGCLALPRLVTDPWHAFAPLASMNLLRKWDG